MPSSNDWIRGKQNTFELKYIVAPLKLKYIVAPLQRNRDSGHCSGLLFVTDTLPWLHDSTVAVSPSWMIDKHFMRCTCVKARHGIKILNIHVIQLLWPKLAWGSVRVRFASQLRKPMLVCPFIKTLSKAMLWLTRVCISPRSETAISKNQVKMW